MYLSTETDFICVCIVEITLQASNNNIHRKVQAPPKLKTLWIENISFGIENNIILNVKCSHIVLKMKHK
jgi:hypothetical protein